MIGRPSVSRGVHSLGNANQPASDEPRKRMGRCSQPTVFQPEEEKVGSECDPSFLHCCVSCMLFDFSPLAEFFTKENFYDKSGEKLFERGDRSCARISPSWFGFLGWYIYICLPRLFWEGLGWVCAKDLVHDQDPIQIGHFVPHDHCRAWRLPHSAMGSTQRLQRPPGCY